MGNHHYSCIGTCKMFPCLGQVRNVGEVVVVVVVVGRGDNEKDVNMHVDAI